MRLWPILLVATTATSVASPRGRVVKIERRRESSVPRMCVIMNETQGYCVGQPEANERMTLIDSTGGGVLAEVKVTSATEEKNIGFCGPGGKPNLYRVGLERISGSFGTRRTGTIIGIRGMRVDSRAQVIKDQPAPGGDPSNHQVMFALDTDADSSADVVVTQYACDGTSSGMAGLDKPMCVDTYLRQGKRLERVHQERLEPCK